MIWGCFQFSQGFSNYLPTLLEQRGVGKHSLYPTLLINAACGVPGKMGGGVLIECFGRRRTIGASIGSLVLAAFAFLSLGQVFLPQLDEGDLLIQALCAKRDLATVAGC